MSLSGEESSNVLRGFVAPHHSDAAFIASKCPFFVLPKPISLPPGYNPVFNSTCLKMPSVESMLTHKGVESVNHKAFGESGELKLLENDVSTHLLMHQHLNIITWFLLFTFQVFKHWCFSSRLIRKLYRIMCFSPIHNLSQQCITG